VSEILRVAASCCTAAALVVVVAGVVRAGRAPRRRAAELAASIALGVEFLLAAGLLRLSALGTFTAIATAAVVVAVRKVVGFGLAVAVRAVR
jgi:uncharacterized membrane protein